MGEWLNMGGHAFWVWGSYGVFLLLVLGELAWLHLSGWGQGGDDGAGSRGEVGDDA